MKCANCFRDAVYELKEKTYSQFYCASDLPWFIKLHKDLGTKVFEVSATPATKVEEEPTVEMNRALHGSTMEAVPAVEEPAVEETVVEKKPSKKKA